MNKKNKIRKKLKNIELEITQNTKESRIKIIAQQLENMQNEGKKLLEEINGLKIDNNNKQKLYDATIKKMAAETNLIWQQTLKTEQETLLTKATTVLTSEQTNLTFTERQKMYKEIEQIKTINAKIEAETKLMEQQAGKVKLEKVTEVIGWINQASRIANDISGTVLKAALMPK